MYSELPNQVLMTRPTPREFWAERGRFPYNGLVAGHPGDSNKTLSCRVNER